MSKEGRYRERERERPDRIFSAASLALPNCLQTLLRAMKERREKTRQVRWSHTAPVNAREASS